MEIKTYLQERAELIEQYLDRYLPNEDTLPQVLHRSMRYSVFAGGKRLRPILLLAACEAVGGAYREAMPAACALEMIHTYSLIHDDLPAMDNDDYRRGKLTNHKVFGDGIAVLAGCGLLTYAFQLIVQEAKKDHVTADVVLQVLEELSAAAGFSGMIGGQVADLEAEGKTISLEELQYIHEHKTGALLRAALRIGALLGHASEEKLQAITVYAEKMGLAFQIIDDILDLIGDEKKLGKKVGSDLQKEKSTYPAFYGLEESKRIATTLIAEAKQEIAVLGDRKIVLDLLADYFLQREF